MCIIDNTNLFYQPWLKRPTVEMNSAIKDKMTSLSNKWKADKMGSPE